MRTFTKTLTITLTDEEVETKTGYVVTEKDWPLFCKAFYEYFRLEHDATLEWVVEEWEHYLRDEMIEENEE